MMIFNSFTVANDYNCEFFVSGTWISAEIPIFTMITDSLWCISDSKAMDSGFHSQKRKNKFRNMDSLTCGEKHQTAPFCRSLLITDLCFFFLRRS